MKLGDVKNTEDSGFSVGAGTKYFGEKKNQEHSLVRVISSFTQKMDEALQGLGTTPTSCATQGRDLTFGELRELEETLFPELTLTLSS